MGRLKPWNNLPPVLQYGRYRRLLESARSTAPLADSSDDDVSDAILDTEKRDKKSNKAAKSHHTTRRNKKKDASRQLIQESFQELMSYSCGQCGHVQTLQAEELKSILGHAFRLAYAAHLQKAAGLHDYPGSTPPPSPPPLNTNTTTNTPGSSHPLHQHSSSHHHLSGGSWSSRRQMTASHSSSSPSSSQRLQQLTSSSSTSSSLKDNGGYSTSNNNAINNTNNLSGLNNNSEKLSSRLFPHDALTHTHIDQRPCDHACLASNCLEGREQSHISMRTPAPLPALAGLCHALDSPDSDTSNSPTDHNSTHRLLDKPPLLKQFSVPPSEDAPPPPSSSPPSHLVHSSPHSSPSHLVAFSPHSSNNNITNNLNSGGGGQGYVNEASKDRGRNSSESCMNHCSGSSSSSFVHNIAPSETDGCSSTSHSLDQSMNSPLHAIIHSSHSPLHSVHSSHSPFHATLSQSNAPSPLASNSPLNSHSPFHSNSPLHSNFSHHSSSCPSPPPLPERCDSLTAPDEPHLRAAAWFQAGIPREIALEVLGQEPLGAFLVRESSSKPGCYALSLRVPTDFASTGIAHYLIVKTSRGYRIKGFTKEFPTLRTLITHHSVMPELLPVPLLLTRHNPAYNQNGDSNSDCQQEDQDYSTLADFRKMMADLNI
ncbi:ras guanine nucleotide exchange factor Y [Hyalella azteca]|uniref:Ras guanine nucleotide exchange factor Y n=1 Tax=Hyalella azteca TaxID=294128 RepID=A0A8B7NJS8_HYAAZ|nr:ras guanine nucleotide exchange factor Y [Hyalella azteca]